MPTLSYDAQSFILDGRRIWLVSGAIHYFRVPAGLWRQRIRAARQAGLNCVETYVAWNVHEPRPGVFDFEGDRDVRRFVQTVGEEGLHCIVRPGPYICAEWDFGGLPAWLRRIEGVRLRESNGPFLEACSRYLGAVMGQLRDLQAAPPTQSAANIVGGKAGPIVMFQVENEWLCHHPEQAQAYLGELVRYLRENGCTVPINECNNLWQQLPGVISTWNGDQQLAEHVRQLRTVQPNAPRIVSEYWPGWFDAWGQPHQPTKDAAWHLRALAGILAVGGQPNLYMFHGGSNPGFMGGRTVASRFCFMTGSYDYDAPLGEAGARGQKYLATKRLAVFASQFAQLFAHLDPAVPHAAVLPGKGQPTSVIHSRGSQGDVVFILKSESDKSREIDIMLADGSTLNVPVGDEPVAWFVVNANLAGIARLTYTNLRPWAFVGRSLLVVFGPAGARGRVCVNNAMLEVDVPRDRKPLVRAHEGLHVVVLNDEQLDAAYLSNGGLIVGAAGLDAQDQPIPLPTWPHVFAIGSDGKAGRVSVAAARGPAAAPRLSAWQSAAEPPITEPDNPAFQPIDGPASLEQLRCDYGYGWYRIRSKKLGKTMVLAPQIGDRLHLYRDGKLLTVLGHGPDAQWEPATLDLSGDVVVLADNLGRFNFGWHMDSDSKGLFSHLYAVKPIKLGKPKVIPGRAPDFFQHRGFVNLARKGDLLPADALVWKFKAAPRQPIVIDIEGLPGRGMLLLNGQRVADYDADQSAAHLRVLVEQGKPLRAGTNELKLALTHKHDPRVKAERHVRLWQATANLTARSEWAFANWAPPCDERFSPMGKMEHTGPCWFRAAFNVSGADTPLWLEPVGMSKGQVYLNGHNVGRFWVSDFKGRPVPPQKRVYLPEPWLKVNEPNELLLFDEHGRRPDKCRLVYTGAGAFG